MTKALVLSVHQLVDFLLRTGDIDNRVFNRSSMQEGSRVHANFQEKQGKDYISEYPLSQRFVIDDVEITLQGRADGIIKRNESEYIVDEIKSTVIDLSTFKKDNFDWHLGQAKCYALMFMEERKLSSIGVRLTYIRQGKEKEKLIDNYTFIKEELEQFVYQLLYDYLSFFNLVFRHNEERNNSISTLTFPFGKYRHGQRELAKYAYGITKNGGRFYCEAPTGIGKTMSTLFPFIKALADDDKSKIFYLTAKTSGKEAAYDAAHILKEHHLILNDILITAKDKICFCRDKSCNPDECPFARGYYNKIQGVLKEALLHHSTFNYETIVSLAQTNQMCPFELELDLSLFCDLIICDYNYLFDPISYMKRYFDEDSSHFLALVDEAHNLVDRSREMYSASIGSANFFKARKSLRKIKHARLKRMMSKVGKMFDEINENFDEKETIVEDFSPEQYKTLNSFVNLMQDLNKNEYQIITKELLDFYLEVNRFLKIGEFYNDRYIAYIKKDQYGLELHYYCLDASNFLSAITKRIKGSVFFSATLSPMDYFVDTLGGNKESDPTLILPSPFPAHNFKLMVAPKVSVKYKNRESSYEEVAEYIKAFASNKIGNYFIYSPSYEYMDRLLDFIKIDKAIIFKQNRDMSEQEKEEFLLHFQNNPLQTTLGFLVIGGAFSEGINLVDDRLIGAIVIGIGMPRLNFESDQIAHYFKEQDKPGHDYAYLNPGMNKIMQAVGRVIRSEEDRGAVLLIDERYMYHQYQELFRVEWSNYVVVLTPQEVKDQLSRFFKG
ncbi:MAG: ATP-dependent DNA helicase [Erysipelotrichaceae bacterium]|nr:ATP-dependent DNA helicase [Erysipelotrichaceae bacterium]